MTAPRPQAAPALVPQTQSDEIKTIKQLISMLVTVCNEKVKNYYVYRVTEPGDMKEELIEFLDHFTDLMVNSADLLRVKIDQSSTMASDKKTENKNLIVLCESWYQMEHYDDDANIYDIYTDGIELFKKYKTLLAQTTLYEAV